MQSKRSTLSALFLLCGLPSLMEAQAGRHAVTLAGVGHVGFVWQMSDGFALRPDFAMTRSHSTSAGNDRTTTNTTLGLSGLFSLFRVDSSLAGYLAPHLSVNMTNLSSSIPFVSGSDESYFAELRLGLRQDVARRFAVFGESGLRYSWASSTGTDSWSLSTSSGVGVQWYFR